MTGAPRPPGGWLQPEEVAVLRRALRAHRATLLSRAQSVRSGPQGLTETALRRAAKIDADAGRLREASAIFDGIEHGARVEALPSPEEERAQEADYIAWLRAVRPAKVGGGRLEEDVDGVGEAGHMLLYPVPDAVLAITPEGPQWFTGQGWRDHMERVGGLDDGEI